MESICCDESFGGCRAPAIGIIIREVGSQVFFPCLYNWHNNRPGRFYFVGDPDVIAGQGTIGMEILNQHGAPLHAIFVPVGGGGRRPVPEVSLARGGAISGLE